VDTPTGHHPVVLNSPRNNGSGFINYALNNLLGPDVGWVQYGSDGGESLNSFGNLDCIPPHGSYPLGRVIVGGAGSRRMEQAIRDFLTAQSIQGPVYQLDSTWLLVGHIDEFMSFIPASNARGWVIGWADVDAAVSILEALPGTTPIFEGTSSETTVGNILNSTSFMDFNDEKQAQLDTLRNTLKFDLGLTDADFIRIPVLWNGYFDGSDWLAFAHTAGAVNWIVVNGSVIVAKQYGPELAGVDKLEEDITSKLAALGITAYYVDDWYTYHEGYGEVHCGSNAVRTPPASPRWWTTGR
jgi:protein-arginine deiminase